jgi:hypothetical protein
MYRLPNTGEYVTIGGVMVGMDVFTWIGLLLILIGLFRLIRFVVKEQVYKRY